MAATNNIRYLIYYPDVYLFNNPYSLRYQVGLKKPSTNEVSYLFQFHPERLKDFELVHQNQLLRVFKRKDVKLTGNDTRYAYCPLFDEKAFKELGVTPDDFLDRWNRAFNMKRLVDDILKKREFGPAQVGLQEILGLFPRYPEALNAMGRIALGRRDVNAGYGYLQKSMAIAPTAEAQYGLVMLSVRNMTQPQIVAAMEGVRAMDPTFFPPYLDLINFYRQQKRYDPAIKICRELLEIYPKYNEGYKTLQSLYYEAGKPDLANKVEFPSAASTPDRFP